VLRCLSSQICFEGNFSNLGTDLIHAPSSLINHPQELLDVGLAGAAIAAPFLLPELGAAFGAADAGAALADSAVALAPEAADIGVGSLAADAGLADIGAGTLAADAGLADIGAGAGDALAADALALAPEDATALAPQFTDSTPFSDIISATGTDDASAVAPNAATAADDVLPSNSTVSDVPGSGNGIPSYPGGSSAASSGGGITGALKDTLASPWTKLGLGLAPLAATLAFGQPKLPPQLAAAEANAQALASGGSALNAAQNASLTQMRQNAINAARQALFNQGVQNPEADTRWSQMVANIDSQVTAAAQTMIQQNIQNSLQGDAQLIQIAQLQMQSDSNFANMLLNATKALGTAAGLGGGTTIRIGS